MPKLIYSIDCSRPPLELAAQAVIVLRVQEYAARRGLVIERRSEPHSQQYLLAIPLDELNSVLDELHIAGLLLPLQEITGRPAAHPLLHERFATLTWIDETE